MINITFPDGRVAEYESGITGMEIAKSISHGLAKNVLAVSINEETVEASRPITQDAKLKLFTWDNPEGKETFWHSSAHVLAEAVQELYPNAKFTIGPPIADGFYYDIDFGDKIPSQDDMNKVEKKMIELARQKNNFVRTEVSKADALKFYEERNNPFKIELIEGLEDGEITFYQQGNFIDLCRGPHIPDTGYIKAVKILNLAGAYWRGSEKNPQLTRIYAVSFPKQTQLDEHLEMLEEAKKRDHRKLGKELDLFHFNQMGPGFPFWHHNGMTILNELQNYLRNKLVGMEYEEIRTPIILNEELWHKSGHYDNYKENMYFTDIDEEAYAVKPMNCPGSVMVFKNGAYSYRDLPKRVFEFGLVHRHELSGVLHGLFRVRSFVQDDAHIYCTNEQIEQEIKTLIKLIFEIYSVFGFNDVDVFLSTRPEKYLGDLDVWNTAEDALKGALASADVAYEINEGDGAFYGPKIDFVVKDSLKREWQLGTIQLDFSMPARFDVGYIGADGEKHTPVMIHRAILGSFERFMGILIEHTAGDFPLWLSPTQIIILPISDKFLPYCEEVAKELFAAGLRVKVDERNEKIGRKIRDAETGKIPYMAVVGEREIEDRALGMRKHKEGDKGSIKIEEVIKLLKAEISNSTETLN